LTLKLKGLEQLVLITDAMRACLLSDGTYDLGGLVVHVKDRAARLENGSLAGSTLVLNQALRNFSTNTGLQPEQAVKLVTVNPARILGLENRKGRIAPGFDADLVLWDADFNIMMTFVSGKKVFTAS
ncbi:MAG TPA: N-acetylglucosamine-6-phosphate deacetylase, partial [Firmicutes bacterium]|nr:N-acetylglucosamine-6-phosphate deacetylase [Bacillota bacterium]